MSVRFYSPAARVALAVAAELLDVPKPAAKPKAKAKAKKKAARRCAA